jgi:micrococcal nuclease
MVEISSLYFYKARIISVYDGDTCRANIDAGFGLELKNKPLRLWGIDAPELRGETLDIGRLSRDALKDLILDKDVIIETYKDKTGKYGRYIAKIWLEDICVNDELVKLGHAIYREY